MTYEAAPSSDLAEADEDPTHGLEIKRLVAAEDENEASKLTAQCLDGLGFA